MRPIAVGRRNWTFPGSGAGGEHAAAIYSLIETAKLHGLNARAYLSHVIAASRITQSICGLAGRIPSVRPAHT